MKTSKVKQRQIRLEGAGKKAVVTQFGALCYRKRDGALQILLVTGRRSGKWGIPKGWPKDNATPAQTAAAEAFEEAGAEGRISPLCLGIYTDTKRLGGRRQPVVIAVYPMKVKRLHAIYPERGQRKRRWMSRKRAAASVANPELRQLIRGFAPGGG